MERQIVVDSDIVVDYLRSIQPQAKVFKNLLLTDRLLLTAVSAYELRVGAEHTKRHLNLQVLFQPGRTLPFDLDAAITAGKILTQLRHRREEISPGDILIAGICISQNLPLLTRNVEHFRRVENLTLVSVEELA